MMGISLSWPSGLEWLAVIPLLSVLVFVHELGHFLAAILVKVRVEEFGFGYPPRALVLFERNGVKFTLNWLPFGGFVRMAGEEQGSEDPGSLASKSPWQRFIVFAAGSTMNVLLAILIYTVVFAGGTPEYTGRMVVGDVAPGSPAAAAGLQPNDILVRIGEQETDSFDSVSSATNAVLGRETTVIVERDGAEVAVQLVPRSPEERPAGQGALGITITLDEPVGVRHHSVSLPTAFSLGLQRVAFLFTAMAEGLGRLILSPVLPSVEAPEGGVSGPVGIARLAGEAAQMGWVTFLDLGAFLSLNFALINALPLPALDGGHIVFVILEWLRRGKKVPPQKEALVHLAGMMLLIGLMVVVSYLDVVRWIQGGSAIPGG